MAELDTLEAEALYRVAGHQAAEGRYGLAIEGYLRKAIRLAPRRAELYAARARYRLQWYCPWLPQEAVFSSEIARLHALEALADCDKALDLSGGSCVDAYVLAVPVHWARGALQKVEEIARRGADTTDDLEVSISLAEARCNAQALRKRITDIEALLMCSAADRQPSEALRLASTAVQSCPDGWRLPVPVQEQLRSLVQKAELAQRSGVENRADQEALWDSSHGALLEGAAPDTTDHVPHAAHSAPNSNYRRVDQAQATGDTATQGNGDASDENDWGSAGGASVDVGAHARDGHGWGTASAGRRTQTSHPESYHSGQNPNSNASLRDEDGALEVVILSLREQLDAVHLKASGVGRHRLLRQLFKEWHPDKRPGEEGLATKVFQWLQDVKDELELY